MTNRYDFQKMTFPHTKIVGHLVTIGFPHQALLINVPAI